MNNEKTEKITKIKIIAEKYVFSLRGYTKKLKRAALYENRGSEDMTAKNPTIKRRKKD